MAREDSVRAMRVPNAGFINESQEFRTYAKIDSGLTSSLSRFFVLHHASTTHSVNRSEDILPHLLNQVAGLSQMQ